MPWLLRLVGWWLVLTSSAQLLGAQLSRIASGQSLWPQPLQNWRELLGFTILIVLGYALISLQRSGSRLFVPLLALWPLVPAQLDLADWLRQIPYLLPDAIARIVLIWLIYQRADEREALRPSRLDMPFLAEPSEDLAWFAKIVACFFLSTAIYRCNAVFLNLVLQAPEPLAIYTSDYFLAATALAALLLLLGIRPAMLLLAVLPQSQLAGNSRFLLNSAAEHSSDWPSLIASAAVALITTIALVVLSWRWYKRSEPTPTPAQPLGFNRTWVAPLVCCIVVYGLATGLATTRHQLYRSATDEPPVAVHTSLKVIRGELEASCSIRNNTGQPLLLNLAQSQLVGLSDDGREQFTLSYMKAWSPAAPTMLLGPGNSITLSTIVRTSPARRPTHLELRGTSYTLGKSRPTTLPTQPGN